MRLTFFVKLTTSSLRCATSSLSASFSLLSAAVRASPMASAANSEAGRRAPGTHYSPSVSAGGVLSTPGQACVLAELDSLDAEIEGLHVSLHDAAVKFGVDVGAPGAASE